VEFYLPLLSTPFISGLAQETTPRDILYLATAAGLTAQWRDELLVIRGIKVGIARQGSLTFLADDWRLFLLANFAPPGQTCRRANDQLGKRLWLGAACQS